MDNNSNALVKECIVKALIELMNKKNFDEISITEICNKAGVSRMSYYRNYYTKKDILQFYLDDISKEFKTETHNLINFNIYTNKNVIKYLFTYFKKYSFFAKTLLKANLSGMLQETLNKYLEEETKIASRSAYQKYHMYSYAGALYNVYIKWIENGMKESIDEISSYFCEANKYIWEAN